MELYNKQNIEIIYLYKKYIKIYFNKIIIYKMISNKIIKQKYKKIFQK